MRQADFGPPNIFHSSRKSFTQTIKTNKLQHSCQHRSSMHTVTIHSIIAQAYIKASVKTSLTHSDPKGGGGQIQSTSGAALRHSLTIILLLTRQSQPPLSCQCNRSQPSQSPTSHPKKPIFSAKMADNIYDEIEIEVCASLPPMLPNPFHPLPFAHFR